MVIDFLPSKDCPREGFLQMGSARALLFILSLLPGIPGIQAPQLGFVPLSSAMPVLIVLPSPTTLCHLGGTGMLAFLRGPVGNTEPLKVFFPVNCFY